jgi:hypothetical protein
MMIAVDADDARAKQQRVERGSNEQSLAFLYTSGGGGGG